MRSFYGWQRWVYNDYPVSALTRLVPSSAAVAQVTVNHLVAGSNPASGVFSEIDTTQLSRRKLRFLLG